jgi:hypothetical protein
VRKHGEDHASREMLHEHDASSSRAYGGAARTGRRRALQTQALVDRLVASLVIVTRVAVVMSCGRLRRTVPPTVARDISLLPAAVFQPPIQGTW